jgi:hypothetical protein
VCLVHSACCLAIHPHTLHFLDKPWCPVRSCSSPGRNVPSCCMQQQKNRLLRGRRPIGTSSSDASALRYWALSAVSQ